MIKFWIPGEPVQWSTLQSSDPQGEVLAVQKARAEAEAEAHKEERRRRSGRP